MMMSGNVVTVIFIFNIGQRFLSQPKKSYNSFGCLVL